MPIPGVDTERVVLHHGPEPSDQPIDHRVPLHGEGSPHATSCDLPVPGRDRAETRARGAFPLRDEQRGPTR